MNTLVNYKLITNNISIKNNHLKDGKFPVDPKISRRIDTIDEKLSAVTYNFELKSTEEKQFPVDIEISITGIFDISKLDKKDVKDFLEIQTCQILFPQIRTMVSTLTAAASMTPLLLPIIDARKLFSENNE